MSLPTPPSIVALAGPNGAGKSTVGPTLLRESLGISILVNADVIAQGLSGLEPEGAWLDSADLAVARVEDRVRAGGHAVPEEVIRRRYRAGLRNFLELYRPLTTRWQVYDNSTGSADAPRLVARGRGERTDAVLDGGVWSLVERSLRDGP